MKRSLLFLLAFSLSQTTLVFAKDKDKGEDRRDNKEWSVEKSQKNERAGEKRQEREKNGESRRQDDPLRQERKHEDDQRVEEKRQKDDQRREDKRQQGNRQADQVKDQDRREVPTGSKPILPDDREKRGRDRDGKILGEKRGNDLKGNPLGVSEFSKTDRDVRDPRDKDKGRNGDRSDDRDRKPRLSKRAENMGVRQLPPDMGKDNILKSERKRSVVNLPSTGSDGQVFKAKVWKNVNQVTVKNHMKTVVKNTTIINQINVYNTQETRRNQYYWHTDNGFKYCHYNDNWGQHWYGWNIGVNFFWTRYHSNNWWWYDTAYDRWCYWHNGWWWWRDPVNVRVVYIYDNDRYAPATEETAAELPPADHTVVEKGTDVQTYRSKDYTRMVRVVADSRDAFLYDTAKPPAFRPVFLQTDVKEVRFSDTSGGKPLQVMLTLYDGTFELYDGQGNPYGSKDYYPSK